jgi:hypothetical protein
MNALNSAIYSKLSGGTALAALVGTRIYNQQAPEGAALPYVVFSVQGGGDENLSPHRTRNIVEFVRAYSGVSAAQAGTIDGQIDALLHLSSLSVTSWTSVWLAREQDLETVEATPAGTSVYMSGGLYRTIIEKN